MNGVFFEAIGEENSDIVFASEWDKFANKAYSILYGEDNLHGDITKINEFDVSDHDVLVAGFPCQAFPVAGRRQGCADTRGTMFFEIARIVKPGGKVLCFGWNSMGIGKTRGFEMQRMLLVPHGGNHNDTICTMEIKL